MRSDAEALRQAASDIRSDWHDEDGREFMFAVALLLDAHADTYSASRFRAHDDVLEAHALAVASAYLEETP